MCWERLIEAERPATSQPQSTSARAVKRLPSRRPRNAGTEGFRLEKPVDIPVQVPA